MIALPWYFTSIIEEPGLFGLIYMCINIVSLFWGLYAGTIVDRYDRRKIFMTITAVGATVMLTLGILGTQVGMVPLWAAALSFASTIFIYNIHYPNLYAFGQEITEAKDYSRITSWLEVQGQVTSAAAGALGALLLEGFQIGNFRVNAWALQDVLLLDGCTYIAAFTLLYFMKFESVADRKIDQGSILARLREGIGWLRAHPLVFLFGTASYAVFVTIIVTGFYLQPRYIEEHLHAAVSTFSISEMFFSLGSVLAGIGIVWIFRNTALIKAVIILSITAAAYFLIGTVNTNHWIMYLTFMLLGTSNAGTRILRMTWLFKHVPNGVIGRTGSVFNVVNVLCRIVFIGLFSIPFFSGEQIVYAFMILGIFILLSTAVMIANQKKLRSL